MVIILYFVFYGWNSILRYEEGAVIINRKIKRTENINPPGIILTQHLRKSKLSNAITCRYLSTLFLPWLNISIEIIIMPNNKGVTTKVYPFTNKNLRHVCKDDKNDNLKTCIENISYSFEEIIEIYVSEDIQQKYFMWSYDLGLIHILNPSKDSINFQPHNTLTLGLAHNLSYYVGFYDPKYRFYSANPKTTPIAWELILEDFGYLTFYIKVNLSWFSLIIIIL